MILPRVNPSGRRQKPPDRYGRFARGDERPDERAQHLQNVYLYPQLNDLCGFREGEVRELLTRMLAELAAAGVARPELTVDAALETMRTFYDGYCFATEAEERIYNPTLTLYFLSALQDLHAHPREMLDVNLAIDNYKLRYVARVAAGRQVVLDLVQTGGPIEVLHLEERFSVAGLRPRSIPG